MQYRHKKKFGQNFLRDRSVIDAILCAAALTEETRTVEIGPGLGALTHVLCEKSREVVVYEIDPDLVEHWTQQAPDNMRLIAGDVLKARWELELPDPPYTMVANLPYNISSQVVFKILDHSDRFRRLVLMFQKEVADRLKADPGTKDYGILSVFCRQFFDIRPVVEVPPGAFVPAPKVRSSVLQFDPLSEPRYPVSDQQLFRTVVKAAFGQRRKTLLNALSAAGFAKETLHAVAQELGLDLRRRGETLSLREFAELTDALSDAT